MKRNAVVLVKTQNDLLRKLCCLSAECLLNIVLWSKDSTINCNVYPPLKPGFTMVK